MKARSLCAASLVAILGAAVLGAASPVLAAPTELGSQGKVTVQEGEAGGPDTPTIDPEDPDKELPDPDKPEEENTNPDTGSLVIEKTTNLDFGTIKTSADDVTEFASAIEFEGGTSSRGVYMQWADVRAGGTYGYTVTAELTQQFTSGTNVLTGSTIDFSNGIAVAQGSNTNTIPGNIASAFQLTETGGAKPVIIADKDNEEGKGRYVMEFGQSSASQSGTPGTDSTSVKLTVPSTTATNMSVGDYTATVTWKITAAQ